MKYHIINNIVARVTERKKNSTLIYQLFSFTMVIFRFEMHSLIKNECGVNFIWAYNNQFYLPYNKTIYLEMKKLSSDHFPNLSHVNFLPPDFLAVLRGLVYRTKLWMMVLAKNNISSMLPSEGHQVKARFIRMKRENDYFKGKGLQYNFLDWF